MNDTYNIEQVIIRLTTCDEFMHAYDAGLKTGVSSQTLKLIIYKYVKEICGLNTYDRLTGPECEQIVDHLFSQSLHEKEEEEELPEYVTTDEIDDIILTLENEKAFYLQYKGLLVRKQAVEIRQSFIYGWIRRCYGNPARQRVNDAQCDYLRKYFDARYEGVLAYEAKRSTITAADVGLVDLDMTVNPTDFMIIQPEEPPMTTKFIETKTFLKGRDVKQLSSQELYAEISTKEAEIEALQKIKNKPARLLKQIEDAQADITALVALIDGLDAPAAATAAE